MRQMKTCATAPPTLAHSITDAWGPTPGTVNVAGGTTYMAAVTFGNVIITVQPPRGVIENMRATDTHNSAVPPPHAYLNAYRWLRENFDASAVVHLGTAALPRRARGRGPGPLVADAVGGRPAGDRQQPGPRGRLAPERSEGVHGAQVGLLREVVGSVGVRQVRQEPPHVGLRQADELPQRHAVAPAGRQREAGDLGVEGGAG